MSARRPRTDCAQKFHHSFLVADVNRTLKNRTKLVWSVFCHHEQTHLCKTTRISVWSQHFCEKSPSPCDEEKSVNLSQSWLNHVFRVFLSSEPKAFAMSTLPGFGMTHPRERLLTPSAASHRRVASRQEMMACLVAASVQAACNPVHQIVVFPCA